jgi:uncharacterized protein YciU (UPF0263 family)
MMKVAYEQLAKEMKTGDIILFNGQYDGSKIIELFERSEWSHVGIVVKLDTYEGPLLWEATSLTNIEDVVFHDNKTGVKLVDLRERLAHYGDELEKYETSNFSYRKLNVQRENTLNEKVLELNQHYHGIEDPSFWTMVWDVVLGRIFRKSIPLDKFFCSEFVAQMYLELGFIDDRKPINAYMPSDFSDQGSKHLHLIKGVLETEIFIDIKHI